MENYCLVLRFWTFQKSQECGNFKNFLLLIFYVKSTLVNKLNYGLWDLCEIFFTKSFELESRSRRGHVWSRSLFDDKTFNDFTFKLLRIRSNGTKVNWHFALMLIWRIFINLTKKLSNFVHKVLKFMIHSVEITEFYCHQFFAKISWNQLFAKELYSRLIWRIKQFP